MKKKLSILLLMSVMAWNIPAPAAFAVAGDDAADTGSEAAAAENSVVVLYEDGEMPEEASEAKTEKAQTAILEDAQTEILDKSLSKDYSIDDTIVIETEDKSADDVVVGVISSDTYSTEELVEKLQDNDSIKYAEPNYIYKISSLPSDWSDAYKEEAWQVGDKGVRADALGDDFSKEKAGEDPVVIAVLDSGIDYNHPDLKDRMWTEPDNFPLLNKKKHGIDMVVNDQDPMDENGHGTHCAGIIAAAADNSEGVIGITGKRNVQLMGVRVLDADGAGYLDTIVSGIKYAIRAKKAGVNVKAINCSLGAAVTSDIFDEAIEQAGQAGILTIAAAGNDHTDNDVELSSPANAKTDYVVAVAATDYDGGLASYSNWGKKNVDIAAPGSNILSSVSYYNYAPYIYGADKIKQTTAVYGEFASDSVSGDVATPVGGTAYDGAAVTEVKTFGASRMVSNPAGSSSADMSLEIVNSEYDSFNIGNNKETLRWKISEAKAGDEFLLYFPYEKMSNAERAEINAVFSTNCDDAYGDIYVGDVIVDVVDENGADWSIIEDSDFGPDVYPIDSTWNSIWHASGESNALFPYSAVKNIDNSATDGSGYGLGFVYMAGSDGNVYVDISSLGISKSNCNASEFGKYDVYSGTSMAAPAVTASVALIAAMNPDFTADDLKATLFASTKESGEAGKWSTNGSVDFSEYSTQEDTSKPAISGVSADFKNKKVTIKGKGFGSAPKVEIHNNVSDAEGVWRPVPAQLSGKNIVLTDSDTLGIIGSDITFKINNGSKEGMGTFYVVKGLSPYNEEFSIMQQEELFFFDWSKDVDDDMEGGEDEELPPPTPIMPATLNYVSGANELLKYEKNGTIHSVYYDKDLKGWDVLQRGDIVQNAVTEYAKKAAEKNEYWAPDIKDTDYISCELLANPVYLGEVVYEMLRVKINYDREAYVLAGLDLNDSRDEWKIYYDSLTGLGSVPAGFSFSKYDKAAFAACGGKLYVLGGAKIEIDDAWDWDAIISGEQDIEEMINAVPYKEVYSCEPSEKGSVWKKEADLPGERMMGTAIAQNGKLYYFLSNTDFNSIDYSVYRLDGGKWSKVGSLNEALFQGYGEALSTIENEFFLIEISNAGIPCSIGIDEKGIVFGGMSFDKSGDTFRFNTSSNKVEPLGYTLWGDVADRDIGGATMDNKFFVEYVDEVKDKAIGKSIPIKSGYVKLNKTVCGEGSGIVMGGGSYTKGDKAKITITPDSGSYIYSVHVDGSSPKLSKDYNKPTAKSKTTHTTTFTANADGELEVYFGKISTKVIIPKKTQTQKVGTREVAAYTDGTISDVKWKSSNKKYAKVNSDGTITFKKAGVNKTVTLTATSVENSKLKAKCKVKIKSREKKKFKWNKKNFTTKTKVMVDWKLSKKFAPSKFNAKALKGGKVKLSWKKSKKKVSGYIVLRKTGSGRFEQIGKLSAKKKSFVDKKAKKGKTYKYVIVGYKKVKGSKAVRISKASKVKTVKTRK